MKKNGKKMCRQNDTINCEKSIIIAKGEFVGGGLFVDTCGDLMLHIKPHRRKYKSAFTKMSRLVRLTALTDWR